MYLDKVLKAMTKEDKQEFYQTIKVSSYSPKHSDDKKYKGDLLYCNEKGELVYW